MDDLKNIWQQSRQEISTGQSAGEMLGQVKRIARKNTLFHWGNMAILAVVVVGLLLFFRYVAPFQETLSHVGEVLMVGSIVLRILIELISVNRLKNLNVAASAHESLLKTEQFYRFRSRIHGPVTFSIIALYTIGFYMLTPEWSLYFPTWQLWLIDGSYVVIAIILFWQIRKGVVQEMQRYRTLKSIHQDLEEED